eukprot:Blabericola_migrator_1__2970@NODE_1859_length_3646_cov_357_337804_g1189_i0_p1_GENE_NODE_1859_length_3646_cov_357_337804_g1189_i0NODE_1859_length_3646_cov_357_337804_g1189_i0_p1_ORF_typecomplete_len378_score65_90Integrin_beta/PF00362_18/2e22VWA/PF00092_28/0_00015VWA/PF00092_28/4_6e03Med25_VWA/PF11265_8/0_0056_NODE_1859_length_3646_cov_357_337804_g1189_i019303063
MRFWTINFLVQIAMTQDQADQMVLPRLEDIFGPAFESESMEAFHKRPQPQGGAYAVIYDERYHATRTIENCSFPLEILFVQDTTLSYHDDIARLKQTELERMIDRLKTTHPGTGYGVVTFKDKPITPLGNWDDYCVKFETPISTDPKGMLDVYSLLDMYGGGDPPEAQYHALLAACQSSTPGWGSVNGATRLIIMSTDSAPHFEGDGHNAQDLVAFTGFFNEEASAVQCLTEYYPTPTQVKNALRLRQAYLGVLVFGGSENKNQPSNSWVWFNRYINQTDAFVHDIENDTSDLSQHLSRIISEIEAVECGRDVSTTPAPSVCSSDVCGTQCLSHTLNTRDPCCDKCQHLRIGFKVPRRAKMLHMDIDVPKLLAEMKQ